MPFEKLVWCQVEAEGVQPVFNRPCEWAAEKR